MSTVNIEKLYQNYGILADAKDEISKHEKEYLEILAAVKGSDKEKRLASPFIAKFFNSFPNLADQAIEAQFELCWDDDVAIRKQAIKDLPKLCKDHKENIQRFVEILAQLLLTDDTAESNIITNSLLLILKIDAKAALTGLFSQINKNYDTEVIIEVLRDRCIKFLATKVKQLGRDVINTEAEELIISECKKLLESQDVTAEVFDYTMDLLTWSRLGKSPVGRQELVRIAAALAFTPDKPDYLERIAQCSQHVLPLFSAAVDSNHFINFFCDHILRRGEIQTPEGAADAKFDLLKLFAEFAEHCGELENPQHNIDAVYDMLMKYLPAAPVEDDENDGDKSEAKSAPSLQFSHIECALFSLHSLCRKAPAALSADADKFKHLRLRLQYTARLTQEYKMKLKEVTLGPKGKDANSKENKSKVAALKCISNINILIRDLFRTPLSFKCKVQLSFQVDERQETKTTENEVKKQSDTIEYKVQLPVQKGHRPITFDIEHDKGSPAKRPRSGDGNFKLYTPTSGKYRSRLDNNGRFSGSISGRGRRGGRRDFRNGAPFRRRNNY